MIRLSYTLLLFCLLPLLPWWASVFLGAGGIAVFRNYFEALGLFFLYELAFGLPSGWLSTQFTFTVVLSAWYLLAEGYRDSILFLNR